MGTTVGLAQIAELGARTVTTSAAEIAAVADLVQRATGVDITVVSELTVGPTYVFRAVEASRPVPVERGAAIPYASSLCSRVHAGAAPDTMPDTREVPAFWEHWLRLKAILAVDWDILAFCTRDIHLPDGTLFGTLCVHHLEPRTFSPDEQALLEVMARMLGQEIWRERAAGDLAEAISALEAEQRLRVELADELRHELQAPLQVIDGYAEAMLDGVVERDDEHLTLFRQETGRAIRLLDDLAELVRLEAAVAESELPSVAADVTVAEMRDRLAPLAEAAGIELAVECLPVTVAVSRKRLEQLVVNLIRNALRAIQDGGGSRVTISVRADGGAAAIGVEDDGPGMAPGELPRAFERFYRGSSESDAASGSGLGLTIARRIVEAAGGVIGAENLSPRGLRVVARLPLAERQPGGDEAPPETL